MNKLTSHVKPSNINQKTIRLDYLDYVRKLIQPGDIYQFGVYSGISIKNLLKKYTEFNIPTNVWGFDSFCGLPKELNEKLHYDVWGEGEFSSCDYLNVKTPEEAANLIKQSIQQEYPNQIEMIVGFYEDSLKTAYNQNMKPASWLDIDVDLYSSTIEAMEFMIKNNLIIPGTLVYYDDWKGVEFGEGRAHIEICKKYNLKMEKLIGDGEILFVVL
jgi:hypothetical protein